ncbi:MAG: hypothetical protein AB8B97_09620 [Granulosicoccus sp.]
MTSTGEQLNERSLSALLFGEVGARPDGTIYHGTCLAPGSLGYILHGIGDADFDSVAEIRAQSLSSSSDDFEQVRGAVLPVLYSLQADGLIAVTLVNNHSETLNVRSVFAIAIDEQGHAFASEFKLPEADIPSGAEFVVNDLFPGFKGMASTIRVIVRFKLPSD